MHCKRRRTAMCGSPPAPPAARSKDSSSPSRPTSRYAAGHTTAVCWCAAVCKRTTMRPSSSACAPPGRSCWDKRAWMPARSAPKDARSTARSAIRGAPAIPSAARAAAPQRRSPQVMSAWRSAPIPSVPCASRPRTAASPASSRHPDPSIQAECCRCTHASTTSVRWLHELRISNPCGRCSPAEMRRRALTHPTLVEW
jgi:hypothetical protein